MEHLYADRLGEHVERLAHHAVRGEVREKAVPYLRQAGVKAVARSALQDARGLLRAGAGRPRGAAGEPVDARAGLRGPPRAAAGADPDRKKYDGRWTRLREAEVLAERLNDDRRRGRVCAFMTLTYTLLGELDEAFATGSRALAGRRSLGDLRLRSLPRPISCRRIPSRVTTSGWSSWPPITSQRCPPSGCTSASETPCRHRSTIAPGWS